MPDTRNDLQIVVDAEYIGPYTDADVSEYLDDIDRLASTIERLYGFGVYEAQKHSVESAKHLRWMAAAIKQARQQAVRMVGRTEDGQCTT